MIRLTDGGGDPPRKQGKPLGGFGLPIYSRSPDGQTLRPVGVLFCRNAQAVAEALEIIRGEKTIKVDPAALRQGHLVLESPPEKGGEQP